MPHDPPNPSDRSGLRRLAHILSDGRIWIGLAGLYALRMFVLRDDSLFERCLGAWVMGALYCGGALAFSLAGANPESDPTVQRMFRTVGWAFGTCGAACFLTAILWGLAPGNAVLEGAATLLFLAPYPLTMSAVLGVPRAPNTRDDRIRILLDSLAFLVSAGLPMWLYALAPALASPASVAWLMQVVYPVVMLAAIVSLNYAFATRQPLPTRSVFNQLQLAFAVFWLSDVLFVLDTRLGYIRRSPVKWTNLSNVAAILIAIYAANRAARLGRSGQRQSNPPGSGPLLMVTMVVVGLWLLIAFHYWDGSRAQASQMILCTVAVLGALAIRETLVIRDGARWMAAEVERESRARFEALVRYSSDITMIVGQDGLVQFASASMAVALGRAPEVLMGHNFEELVHPDDRAAALQCLGGLFSKAGTSATLVLRLRRAGGTYGHFEMVGSNAHETAQIGGVILNLRDVTERLEEAERLRQAEKLAAIGQLVSGIAHNFNNILTATLLRLEDLRARPNLPRELASSIGALDAEANRSADLTRRLVEFGQQQLLHERRIDLGGLARGLRGELGLVLGSPVVVESEVPADPVWVKADPTLLRQVVLSLATNARDAMPHGGSFRIEVFAGGPQCPQPPADSGLVPGTFACLSLRDTGTGMSEEVRSHLFEPFFTTKSPSKSTGMGLASAHGIVRQHRGWITVESAPGKGSAFRIFLPRVEGSTNPFGR